ncbi:fimbrial protein [Stenotrophomonas sp. C3(2023)]|uniref:fimbrial protein n=1 Tax=Stenotrophomonas sp. C3(2023) TaxID=3080277 RepID=UPI00293CF6B1|nr:fimbrial protein [Stenotrophomonas sp. C3(2023)]MDV3470258.1 fimbrial protein [Stenotrophomonas sp. C3(2023)]
MKHIATAVAVILSSSGICAAQAADGTISFVGVVTASTCKVEAGTAPGSNNPDFRLDLGTVSTSAMNNDSTNRRSATQAFNVYVGGPGGNCPATTARTASVRLDAKPGTVGAGFLPNTAGTGGADNVGVVILNPAGDEENMAIGWTTPAQAVDDTTAATFNFWGALKGYGAVNSSTAGSLAADMTYTVMYQ